MCSTVFRPVRQTVPLPPREQHSLREADHSSTRLHQSHCLSQVHLQWLHFFPRPAAQGLRLATVFTGPSLIWSGTTPSSRFPHPSTLMAYWSSGIKQTMSWSHILKIKKQNTGLWTTSWTCGTPFAPHGTPRLDSCRCGLTVNKRFGNFQLLVRAFLGTPLL